jgi:hypothetical protein
VDDSLAGLCKTPLFQADYFTPGGKTLEIEPRLADNSNGAAQMEYCASSGNEVVISTRCAPGHREPECLSARADNGGPALVKLPPGRFRSLGGYFNYDGWPDQQRFMELDDVLRLNPLRSSKTASRTDSSDACRVVLKLSSA